jgi:uncharacterized membrane protein YfcA
MDFPPLADSILLFFSAMLASALNAVAGGGTFFVFPALMSTGVSALVANATSTVAVWPGVMASAFGYRKEVTEHKKYLPFLCTLSLIGGWIGAKLLLQTPEISFSAMVPWLLLTATLLFTFGKRLTNAIQALNNATPISKKTRYTFVGIAMLVISIYGGFFGAGIGILMLAMLQCMGLKNIHQMNALKTILSTTIQGTAVFTFLPSGIIVWPQAIIMCVGALIGGYGMAKLALRIPQSAIRKFVICVASSTTIYYFLKTFYPDFINS